jgi:hypothetical protein
VLGKDALDGIPSDLVAEVAERAADPGVAPAWVLGGELDDQALQRSGSARTASSSLRATVVLLGNELSVPAKDRVRRHQPGELRQRTSADRSALRREPPPLDVGEAQTPATELLAKHTVLLLEVLDDLDLAAVHPAREHQEQEIGAVPPTSSAILPRGARAPLASRRIRKVRHAHMVSPDPVLAHEGNAL